MNDNRVQVLLESLASEEGRLNPYPIYQQLREHPPVYDERHRAYLTTRYRDCAEALTGKAFGRPDTLWLDRRVPPWREHPGLVIASRMMQFGDPATHARLRGSVTRYLTPRRINSLVEFESHSVDALLDNLGNELENHGVADILESLCYQMPSVSIAGLLGIPADEVRDFLPYTQAMTNTLEPGLTAQQLVELDDAYDKVGAYFIDVIAERRRTPRDDLATHLVQCCDEQHTITPEELMPMLLSVYGAGSFNTSNFIGNGIAALLAAPTEAAALRADPDRAGATVTEILRYDAPMQVTRRIAVTDTELSGTPIPSGAEIAVILGAANRDPDVFEDPDVFRTQRVGSRPLSFGAGTFYCIGTALARLEGALVFQKLISRFPSLRIAEGATHNRRSVLRGYLSLPVTLNAAN